MNDAEDFELLAQIPRAESRVHIGQPSWTCDSVRRPVSWLCQQKINAPKPKIWQKYFWAKKLFEPAGYTLLIFLPTNLFARSSARRILSMNDAEDFELLAQIPRAESRVVNWQSQPKIFEAFHASGIAPPQAHRKRTSKPRNSSLQITFEKLTPTPRKVHSGAMRPTLILAVFAIFAAARCAEAGVIVDAAQVQVSATIDLQAVMDSWTESEPEPIQFEQGDGTSMSGLGVVTSRPAGPLVACLNVSGLALEARLVGRIRIANSILPPSPDLGGLQKPS